MNTTWIPVAGERAVVTAPTNLYMPGDVLVIKSTADAAGNVIAQHPSGWANFLISLDHLRPFDPDRDDTVPVPRKALDELRDTSANPKTVLDFELAHALSALFVAVDKAGER